MVQIGIDMESSPRLLNRALRFGGEDWDATEMLEGSSGDVVEPTSNIRQTMERFKDELLRSECEHECHTTCTVQEMACL